MQVWPYAACVTVSAKPEPFSLSPDAKRVFAGLMLGMFVASISQMIVSPAMPRIVAELGGMDHYSWVATAAMIVSALIGILFFAVIAVIERLVVPWHASVRET